MKVSAGIQEFNTWRGLQVSSKSVVRYGGILRIFCLALQDPDIEKISIQQILRYFTDLERLGWSPNGIGIIATALRTFFEYCNLRGLRCINEALIPFPRQKFRLLRIANEADFKKLLAAIPPRSGNPNHVRNLALLHLIWDSWARSGEVVSLDIADLQFAPDGSGAAVVKTEKSRGRRPIREIFWTPYTGKLIKAWLRKKAEIEDKMIFHDKEAVFTSIRKSGVYDVRGKRMTSIGVCEVFRMLSNRAGLPSILNAHSIRHYGGRKIIREGGANADVSNILGHSHLDSSQIYTMLWGKDLRDRWKTFQTRPRRGVHYPGSFRKRTR